MYSAEIINSVIIIAVMLTLSAFFSGMEIAFLSKNRLMVEIGRKQSRFFDMVAGLFERHPGQYITTILVWLSIRSACPPCCACWHRPPGGSRWL